MKLDSNEKEERFWKDVELNTLACYFLKRSGKSITKKGVEKMKSELIKGGGKE